MLVEKEDGLHVKLEMETSSTRRVFRCEDVVQGRIKAPSFVRSLTRLPGRTASNEIGSHGDPSCLDF